MSRAKQNLWGIVLAGGEGERLRGFVRERLGTDAPKQFCAFSGPRTMVEHTLQRAEMVIPRERQVVVATAHHRPYIFSTLCERPPGTLLLQPVGRDTGAGIMLPLVHVLHRDPDAMVAIFPSDHFIMPGRPFMDATSAAAARLTKEDGRSVVLLAVEPTDAETDYGWIEPGAPAAASGPATVRRIKRFVEKPPRDLAGRLMAEGWLWNTMVMVARAKTLVAMVQRTCPELAARFFVIQRTIGSPWEAEALERTYQTMPCVNFSATVLARCPDQLRVLLVRKVLWSDWGREERILATLKRLGVHLPSPVQVSHA